MLLLLLVLICNYSFCFLFSPRASWSRLMRLFCAGVSPPPAFCLFAIQLLKIKIAFCSACFLFCGFFFAKLAPSAFDVLLLAYAFKYPFYCVCHLRPLLLNSRGFFLPRCLILPQNKISCQQFIAIFFAKLKIFFDCLIFAKYPPKYTRPPARVNYCYYSNI